MVVMPVEAGSGCCIAASYEAKAFGIRTGTRVGEARLPCPEVAVTKVRHSEYVRFHLRIIEAIETCIPVAEMHSIDEASCRLDRRERTPEAATALALRIKAAIRERVGECLRCSIGVAPNTLLAKVGTHTDRFGVGLGKVRWVVERTIAWLHQFCRLRVRHERRADIHQAFLSLGGILICYRTLQTPFC